MAAQIQSPVPRHFVFIVNPLAGQRQSKKIISQFKQMLQASPQITYDVVLTEKAGHATEIAAREGARHQENALVFACGGDGTANEVVNGLYGTKATMGVLPIGTANDFCKAALSTTNLSDLISKIPQPNIRPIDLIQFDDNKISLNILSLGFDSVVQQQATRLNRKLHLPGSIVYPLAIITSLMGKRDFSMRYELDIVDKDGAASSISGDSLFILSAVCNGRYYGGGFNPAPQALLDDGSLDVCIVEALSLLNVMKLLPKYKKGSHLDSPLIKLYAAVGGTFRGNAGDLPGNADGELFKKNELTFKVLPQVMPFAFY